MKKDERGVGLAVVTRALVFFFSIDAIGNGRKKQKMKKAESGVGLAVVNRGLVFFFFHLMPLAIEEIYKR